jgi:hypothetical protein
MNTKYSTQSKTNRLGILNIMKKYLGKWEIYVLAIIESLYQHSRSD